MKKRLWIILFLLFVIGTYTHASELPDFPFVFAQGQAEIKRPPDIATISFQIEQFDEQAVNALTIVRNRSAELIAFFEAQKINEKDIVAYEIDKRAVRERKDHKKYKIIGYEITRNFSVKLEDLNRYEQFIKKLLSLDNVTNIKTEFDRRDRKQIEADLLVKAGQDARAQAELMAKGFQTEIGSVFAISQRGFQDLWTEFGLKGGYAYARLNESDMRKSDFLFIPSTINFQNTVTVIFKLKGR